MPVSANRILDKQDIEHQYVLVPDFQMIEVFADPSELSTMTHNYTGLNPVDIGTAA